MTRRGLVGLLLLPFGFLGSGAPAVADEADPGPFGIDGPDHSDRDRTMFILGYEYARIVDKVWLSGGENTVRMTIHRANTRRAMDACNAAGRACTFADTGLDEWVYLDIWP